MNELAQYLIREGEWRTALQCCMALDLPLTESGKRVVRSLAEDSRRDVISGDHGYKARLWATIEERRHAARRLRSQAYKMLQRADDIEWADDACQQGELFAV